MTLKDRICWLPRLHERDVLKLALERPTWGPLLMPSLVIWAIVPLWTGLYSIGYFVATLPRLFGSLGGLAAAIIGLTFIYFGFKILEWLWRAFYDHMTLYVRKDPEHAQDRLAKLKARFAGELHD